MRYWDVPVGAVLVDVNSVDLVTRKEFRTRPHGNAVFLHFFDLIEGRTYDCLFFEDEEVHDSEVMLP